MLKRPCFHIRLDASEASRVSGSVRAQRGAQHPFAIVKRAGGKGFLSFLGFEHAGGNFRYEAAGDEAFAVGAEIVSEAGDDVTFAGGQSF